MGVCKVPPCDSAFASSLSRQDLASMVRPLVHRRPRFVRINLSPHRVEVNRHRCARLRPSRGGTHHQVVIPEIIKSSHLLDATIVAPFLSVELFHVDPR